MSSISQVSRQVDTCTSPALCYSGSSCRECAEIREVKMQISILEERKSAAISRINARRDLLTSRLSLEVVCQIFQHYVKLHSERYSKPHFYSHSSDIQVGIPTHFSSSSSCAPIYLGAVCRQWRNIAWSHPPLWNNLYIDLSDSHGHEYGPEIVAGWLVRSRGHPLDIRVSEAYGINRDGAEDQAVAMMNIIKQFSSRWRNLDIHIQYSEMMYSLKDSYFSNHQRASSTSLLRSLSLVGLSYELPFEKLLHPTRKLFNPLPSVTLLTNALGVI